MLWEIIWDILTLLWVIVRWPFEMAGLLCALGFMKLITWLGFWHVPVFPEQQGYLKFPWND